MTDFNGKLNLLKLKRAGVMQIPGRTEVLRCLVIPIEENNIFISTDENNRPKAAYLDLTAWELKNPKYEETHMIKQSLSKEVREKMTDEEKKAMPSTNTSTALSSMRSSALMDSNSPKKSSVCNKINHFILFL